MTYAQVVERLEEIEAHLADLKLEEAGRDFFTVKRRWEVAHAVAFAKTDGTVRDREAAALLALKVTPLHEDYVQAEARWEALKATQRLLETRASIGQSLLRAMTAEGQRAGGPQPQWSGGNPQHFKRREAA